MNKQTKLLNQLFTAVKTGDAETVKQLAAQGVPLNTRQPKTGFSPFLIAAGLGKVEVAACLAKNGVDVNEGTPHGTTALMLAAAQGHIPMVNWLLNNGADVSLQNASDANVLSYTLKLFEGTEQVLNDIVKLLLAHHADTENIEAELGFTPLMIASQKGYFTIVKLLVAHGAKVNAVSDGSHNNENQTENFSDVSADVPLQLITVSVPETPLTLAKTPEIRTYLKKHGAKE
jgi:ankyrin repeat protein